MHKRMVYWTVGVAVAALVATMGLNGSRAATKDADDMSAQVVAQSLMRQKLNNAQRLLEALSLGDYMRIQSNAEELQRISLEARWTQPHSPQYAEYGEYFRSALERIVISAENQNIDGAALNYVQVVLTCVQCHKVVREGQELASLDRVEPLGLLDRRMAALLQE